MDKTPAPIFRKRQAAAPPSSSAIPSSSPAFGTPAHPLKPFNVNAPKAAILPIILPPPTLRPLAFRTFTKKHSLTLTSSALQELATFIGRHCGSGWREEGLAERVLEEVARSWKGRNGGVIIEGTSKELQDILKTLEGNMSGGKIIGPSRSGGAGGAAGRLSRADSMLSDAGSSDMLNTRLGLRPAAIQREDSGTSFGMSGLGVHEAADIDDETVTDPRAWIKVIDAFEQPRLMYNVEKKHFERESSKPTLLPTASHKTAAFRNRYHVIHQRLLRNEAFQPSSISSTRRSALQRSSISNQQSLKITPIANLLGRHGSNHMLLGQLVILPTGNLAISDLTGTIALDLDQAVTVPEDSAWFCPGMIVLVDGVYEEEDESVGKGLGGGHGVGGTLGGRFQGFFIGQPPCEKRRVTLGMSDADGGQGSTIGGGFGWIDFLGVGSERAVGAKMRRLEKRLLRSADDPFASTGSSTAPTPGSNRVVLVGELNLDQPRALQALHKILSLYASEADDAVGRLSPLTFVLTGSFTEHAVMARGGSGGSIEYKEYFDALASTLSEFPRLLQSSTFVFVPGDNDGWVSSFTAGASTPLPRKGVPNMFTSRIRRAFASANAEVPQRPVPGSAVWSSNPSRISFFGPHHELVVFRDDMSSRLRRTSVNLKRTDSKTVDHQEGERQEAQPQTQTQTQDDTAMVDLDADSDPALQPSPSPSTPHDVRAAQKLVKSVLDQGYLAPFRQAVRPVHWDHSSAMHLYPVPTAMALVDTTAPPFCITYEGCHVMNPGGILVPGKRGVGRWLEYEVGGLGELKECTF
ncbi:DNA polymerase epsilon subunit 2 [Geosmithia morbida]|uniref:DNA polymerase epsilon subunit B n=1 Tax=Geosmithia morbida TaxID=1094350 RepID=A0A9P4YYT3_9HYPO|nr:DNA polymerase epsilon subunit 2 [Geosmithia morbida]KAF4124269.1 DNA polymerase epsilon subunit 2 [Geosmithia morbida]